MNEIIIKSNSQIEFEIENINIGKIGKNSTEDEELYLLLMLLRNNIDDIGLTVPFTIQRQDKPDIVLNDKNKEIGIEFTYAINEAYQKAKMLRDQKDKSMILEPSLYNNNKNRKYIEETIEKSNKSLYGSAYIDDELEKESAELILNSIKKKFQKSTGYDKFKENFLFISSEVLFADEKIVVSYIQKELRLISNMFFDKIILRFNGKNIFLI